MNDVKNHIIAALASFLFIAAIAAYFMGRNAGIRHAIFDSDDSAWGQYDQLIFIDLDGMIYEHGMYQG